jgi:hypothetical protein
MPFAAAHVQYWKRHMQFPPLTSPGQFGATSTKNTTPTAGGVGGAGPLDPSKGVGSSDDIVQQFLDLAKMNPFDRMRANILKSMGISEQDLANMSPQERQAVEDKIRQMIEQQFKKNADQKGQVVDMSA